MKTIAPFAIALLVLLHLVSCASGGSGVIDERTLDCGPGQDISVEAGVDAQQSPAFREQSAEHRFELLVVVANNSSDEITVAAIRADQPHSNLAQYRIDGSYRKFDQVIEEGKEHTFRLPLTGRGSAQQDPRTTGTQLGRGGVELAVMVMLSNGDSYRCLFDISAVR